MPSDDFFPDELDVIAPYRGHNLQVENLPDTIIAELNQFLTAECFALVDNLKEVLFAKSNLFAGRYPYEYHNGKPRFESGDEARKSAEQWLDLARSLAKFLINPDG